MQAEIAEYSTIRDAWPCGPGGQQVRDLASEAGMPMSYVVVTDDRAA
jgi:hypothetical protein